MPHALNFDREDAGEWELAADVDRECETPEIEFGAISGVEYVASFESDLMECVAPCMGELLFVE